MENYIVINGKKAELTKEQLETLGISPGRNNPFDRAGFGEDYFVTDDNGAVDSRVETFEKSDDWYYNSVNYFNGKKFAQQMSLRWLLNRKLEKYAWDNEAEDIEWNDKNYHYCIHYLISEQRFVVYEYGEVKTTGIVYFSDREVAEKAIKDVIEPFMSEHPEFRW